MPDPTPSPSDTPPPKRIGPYEILGELGRGGMGLVYRARRAALDAEYALKVILPGRGGGEEMLARFKREARAAARLGGHPGIVGVHDIGESDGVVWFAMDLVEGGSLQELLDSGELTIRRAVELTAQAARAVHHAHLHGILHRDLKPENVLIGADGRARVTDFGLAKAQASGAEVTRLTKSGHIIGTPAYMAPEQASGEPLGPPTDVYGLGATLFEALTARPPFLGDTLPHVLTQVLHEPPPPLRRLVAEVPPPLEVITLHCLAKRPADRYPTAEALAEDLERWLRGEPITVQAPSVWERGRRWARRHRGIVAAGVIGLVLAGAGVAAVVVPRLQAEAAARAAAEAARLRRDRAQPHLDAGREVLVRIERQLGQPDTTSAELAALADEARGWFARALAADPGSAEAMLATARAYLAQDDRRQAKAWCDRAIAQAPAFQPARMERALLLLNAYAEARSATLGEIHAETPQTAKLRIAAQADLEAAAAGEGAEPGALAMARGLLLFAAGRWREAGEQLQAHAEARAADPHAWLWTGWAWLNAGAADRAALAFTEALRYRPRDAVALFSRASFRQRRGDLDGAFTDYTHAVASNPRLASAWANRGMIRHDRGDYRGALDDYEQALAIAPESSATWDNVGNARKALGDRDGALAAYDRSLELAPDNEQARFNRALARRAAGDAAATAEAAGHHWDGARDDYDRILDANPKHGPAWYCRGNLRLKRGDFAGAAADFTEAIALDPKDASPLVNRASAFNSLGRPQEAIADCTAAIALKPDHRSAWHNRAVAKAQAGDEDGALQDLAEALRLERDAPSSLYFRSTILLRRGRLTEGLRDLDHYLRLRPNAPFAHADRGLALKALGRVDEAIAAFERALQVAPPDWRHRPAIARELAALRRR